MYECRKCGRVYTLEEITITFQEGGRGARANLRCPYCNGRTFEKTRPKTVRKVKAR